MPIIIPEKPHKKVWRILRDEEIQQVYECRAKHCRLFRVKQIFAGQLSESPKCECGNSLVYQHTEIGE